MTVTEFVDYVRNRHNAGSDSFWSDSEIYSLIKARADEVVSIIGLIEGVDTSITTVASTQAYDYPTNYIFFEKVYYDNTPLTRITLDEWDADKATGTTDATGTPDRYFLWNNKIYLVPIPSAAETVTLYGLKCQSDITSSSSTIDLPAVLHSRLADGVIADMFAKDQKVAMMDRYEQKWMNVHIPAFYQYRSKRHSSGSYTVTHDVDGAFD